MFYLLRDPGVRLRLRLLRGHVFGAPAARRVAPVTVGVAPAPASASAAAPRPRRVRQPHLVVASDAGWCCNVVRHLF